MEEPQANDNLTSLGNGTQAHIRVLELSISDPVHKPQDQADSVGPSTLLSSRNISKTHLGLTKAPVSFSSLEQQMLSAPSTLPGSACPPAGAGLAQGVSPYSVPRRCSGHADLHSPLRAWGTRGQGAAWLENPHTRPLMSPARPSGDGCETTEGGQGKQQGVPEAKGKTRDGTQGTSPGLLWAWGLWGLP